MMLKATGYQQGELSGALMKFVMRSRGPDWTIANKPAVDSGTNDIMHNLQG